MNVWLSENNELLPGDLVARLVVRSDLTPVPRTVELSVRLTAETEARIKEGESIWTGQEALRYRIVKVSRSPSSGLIQGDREMAVLNATAILHMSHRIGFRAEKAVIKERARFSDIYRACGAQVAVADDFVVRRFSCFFGQVPSFHLAQALQEEGGALVLRDKKIRFMRLPDLFKQAPVTELVQSDTTETDASEFMERHEIPSFFSTDDAGAFVRGDFDQVRAVNYAPRADVRTLRNMSRVLVTRRVLNSNAAGNINAGDLIRIMDKNLVVVTAAHAFEQSDGATEARSRFWLAELNK
jgi:hypothetical protein